MKQVLFFTFFLTSCVTAHTYTKVEYTPEIKIDENLDSPINCKEFAIEMIKKGDVDKINRKDFAGGTLYYRKNNKNGFMFFHSLDELPNNEEVDEISSPHSFSQKICYELKSPDDPVATENKKFYQVIYHDFQGESEIKRKELSYFPTEDSVNCYNFIENYFNKIKNDYKLDLALDPKMKRINFSRGKLFFLDKSNDNFLFLSQVDNTYTFDDKDEDQLPPFYLNQCIYDGKYFEIIYN